MGLNESNKLALHSVSYSECGRTSRLESNCFSSSETEDFRSNEVPPIVPCYNGKTLKIHEELVVNGLCAISIKHHNGNCTDEKQVESRDSFRLLPPPDVDEDSENNEKNIRRKKFTDLSFRNYSGTNGDVPECLKDGMKRRNSFWHIHRPELSKLTWPENFVSSAALQDFFHKHLRIHGTFCEPLHEFSNRNSIMDEEFRDYCKLREIVPPRILPPDEKVVNIMEKSRSVQLNDEDLAPETQVHKSRAEFCVTIGEYVRRPPLKKTTSQVVPKCVIQPATRFESLPIQHEGLLSKELIMSEERVSAVIGSTDLCMNSTSMKNSKKLSSGIVLRCTSFVDSQRMAVTSPPSLNAISEPLSLQRTEYSGDPARMNSILPREEETRQSGSGLNQV